MPILRRRPKESSRSWLTYRLDRFLALHPAVQLAAVLIAAFTLALAFGWAIAHIDDRGFPTAGDGLWWAINRMLDGGNVAEDTGLSRRAFGVGVTLVGMVAMAVLTGAFASSFAARIHTLRQGRVPIFERGHLIFLGWNGRAGVIVRELAASGIRATVVIVSTQEREVVEERVLEGLDAIRHRLRIIVRCGDPTTTAGIQGAAARRAAAALILPEEEGEAADRVALRSLLALRRVVREARVPVVVETSGKAGREMVLLCADPEQVVIVEVRDLTANLLVHSLRQPGSFEVIRQILSLDARSIYIHPAGVFVGRTFDEAHAAIESGVLVGVLRGRAPALCPDGDYTLKDSDKLLVFSDANVEPRGGGKLPMVKNDGSPRAVERIEEPQRISVLVIRYKPELAAILSSLDVHCACDASVLAPAAEVAQAQSLIGSLDLRATRVHFMVGDPLDVRTLEGALSRQPEVALLLAPDVSPAEVAEADADQLITLLQARQLQGPDRPPLRAVVEVRSPETERLVGPGDPSDFILSREIEAMMLAQELHALCLDRTAGAWLGAVYHQMLDAIAAGIELQPLALYSSGLTQPTFAHLAAAARQRGEIAIGVAIAGEKPDLLPKRGSRFESSSGARVVVLAPGRASERIVHTPASAAPRSRPLE